jgi:mono/diheme cytochrome c family protein
MIKYLPDELSARYIKPWLTITKVLVAVGLATMFWSPYRAARAQQEDVIEAGRRQFTEKCAVCHGLSGKGDGALAAKLKGQPADLTRLSEKYGGTFPYSEIYAKIDGREEEEEIIRTHIASEMPAFYSAPSLGNDKQFEDAGGRLAPVQIRQIVSFLQTIQEE